MNVPLFTNSTHTRIRFLVSLGKTRGVRLSQGVLICQCDKESFLHQRSGAEYFVRVSLRKGRASAGNKKRKKARCLILLPLLYGINPLGFHYLSMKG